MQIALEGRSRRSLTDLSGVTSQMMRDSCRESSGAGVKDAGETGGEGGKEAC